MWNRWLISLQMCLLYQSAKSMPGSSNNYKINPKPCTVNSLDGTCMFVWECIKSEGQHIGMCVDSFMFGSCCAHNLTENIVVSHHQSFEYKPNKPNKNRPTGIVNSNRPSHISSNSGTTTIHRPHGGGTLVIRNRPPQHQHYIHKIPNTPAPISTTVNLPNLSENTVPDLDTASSYSTGVWNMNVETTAWHMTTQPNFITKPRPTTWDKLQLRPKPKPSKKPIVQPNDTINTYTHDQVKKPTTNKPKPQQTYHPKPTKTVLSTTQRRPATKPATTSTTSLTTRTTTTTTTPKPRTTTTTPYTTPTTRRTTLAEIAAATDETTVTEQAIDLSSPVDSNDVLEDPNQVTRYTLSAAKTAECGLPTMVNRPETRIVGGKNAPFGRWPWQVSVRRTSFFGFSSTHRCGGAVINENWIATAGHCVDDLLTSQIRIRVGEYDFSHIQEQLPYIERAVAKKIVHPKYNFFTYEYDLALVKLDAPLEFAPHIAPICLPGTDDLLIGQNATVTGWGRLSEGGTLPSVLQEVSVPIVSNDRCKTMFLRAGRHEFIPEIFLCAGHENGGHDSCQGDSGGPLQVKGKDGHYFLAGIISWGIGCAEANLPGVCTRISKFTPWILENVV